MSHYYYTEYFQQSRFSSDQKSVLDCLQQLREIEEEERETIKQEVAKQTGYTGLSLLHRLYPLCGFVHDKDLVFDEMHTIQLNVVKRALSVLLGPDQGIAWQTVGARLDAIPWTRGCYTCTIMVKCLHKSRY